eukprot:XP_011456814.1 PREDICTED: sushi, von Willebrand factor type A, EGF and pentraxin domain-containing protein 1 [Crassostrea gigas]
MKNRLCSQLNCQPGFICVTTVEDCANLNYYKVACQEILCPVPVGNAVLSSTCSRKIGVSCPFSCTEGHLSTTVDNIRCTSNGTWNLSPTTLCLPIVCPKSVGNAVISPNCSRMVGKSCTYSCTHGYIPKASNSVVCTSEGSWEMDMMDNDTLCSPIVCPKSVGNAVISPNCSRMVGKSCTYSCTHGYIPKASNSVVCTSEGSWEMDMMDNDTLCSPIVCPKSVGNAVISPNCSRMVGKSCTYSCTHGYIPKASNSVVCTSEGSWEMDMMDNDTLCSPIVCPKSVGNAVISPNCSRMVGKSCTYSCTHGYIPKASNSVVCTSEGSWEMDMMDNDTLCSPIVCPKSVGNAVISPNCSRMVGKSCTYSCTHGYIPKASNSVVCTSEGSWEMDMMDNDTLCSPIVCPKSVGNAVISPNCSRMVGKSCTYSCTHGYIPKASNSVVCTSEGSWEMDMMDNDTLCSPIVCPKSVDNAVISPNCSRMVGKSCTYSCTHGYISKASNSVVCTSEGSWEMDMMDNDTLCSLIHCPLDVINGNISSSCRGLIGEKCYMICDNSVNTVNIVCLSTGSWNKDTTAICSLKNESVRHCPLDVINGDISSSCQGLIGEKCYMICDNSVNTVNIVCLSSGSWDKDTTAICCLKNESEICSLETSRPNMTFLYAGTSVAGTLIVVIIIVGVTCLIKRRNDTTRYKYFFQRAQI